MISDWQPIATAPRDATVILTIHEEDLYPVSAYCLPDSTVWRREVEGPEDCIDCPGKHDILYRDPTHWMPLPGHPIASARTLETVRSINANSKRQKALFPLNATQAEFMAAFGEDARQLGKEFTKFTFEHGAAMGLKEGVSMDFNVGSMPEEPSIKISEPVQAPNQWTAEYRDDVGHVLGVHDVALCQQGLTLDHARSLAAKLNHQEASWFRAYNRGKT